MNWYSQPRGEGFEYHLLVLGILAVLAWKGGGKPSLDLWLSRRFQGAPVAERAVGIAADRDRPADP